MRWWLLFVVGQNRPRIIVRNRLWSTMGFNVEFIGICSSKWIRVTSFCELKWKYFYIETWNTWKWEFLEEILNRLILEYHLLKITEDILNRTLQFTDKSTELSLWYHKKHHTQKLIIFHTLMLGQNRTLGRICHQITYGECWAGAVDLSTVFLILKHERTEWMTCWLGPTDCDS